MTEAFTFPPVTADLLAELVERVAAVGDPHKIVLFGSRARGDARPDSDLDILIVEESDLPRYKRAPRYLRTLVGMFPAKDVVHRQLARRRIHRSGRGCEDQPTVLHQGQAHRAGLVLRPVLEGAAAQRQATHTTAG